jgi:hypothetical protein
VRYDNSAYKKKEFFLLEGTFNKIAAGGIIVFMEPELLVGLSGIMHKKFASCFDNILIISITDCLTKFVLVLRCQYVQ